MPGSGQPVRRHERGDLRATRLLFTVGGKSIYEIGQLNFDELHAFLGTVKPSGRGADAGRHVLKEIRGRLDLLLGIGLDYLNFNRRSGTLSVMRMTDPSGMPQAKLMDPSAARESGARILYSLPPEASPASTRAR